MLRRRKPMPAKTADGDGSARHLTNHFGTLNKMGFAKGGTPGATPGDTPRGHYVSAIWLS